MVATRPFHDLETTRYALHFVSSTVDRLDHAQLQAASPCSEWTVVDVIAHLAEVLDKGTAALLGTAPVALSKPARTASDVRRAGRDFLIAADAADLNEAFTTEIGSVRGRSLVGHLSLDLLVHGWDITRAAELTTLSIDPAIAEAALAFARREIAVDRRGSFLAPEVPVDPVASAQDRLAGFLGRTPRWSPRLVSA